MSDDTTTTASLPYKILKQRHPDYDAAMLRELDDLYVGGYQLRKNVRKYLPQLEGEHPTRYEERLKTASYINYFAEIVDKFCGDLFAEQPSAHVAPEDGSDEPQPPPDREFYAAFARDADQADHSFANLLEEVTRRALVFRVGILGLDLPSPTGEDVPSRAAEDALGLRRVYALKVLTESLTNWKRDARGDYDWMVLSTSSLEQTDPTSPSLCVEEFKIWRRVTADGVSVTVRWEKYSVAHDPNIALKDDDLVPLVASGTVSFERIPVMCFELPPGLWVGNKIGPLALEHFQRRSALVSAQNKNLVSIPVVNLGSEVGEPGGELPSDAQQNPNRGNDPIGAYRRKGWVVLGKDDRLSFAEPSGQTYEVIDKQLESLKDEMHRVVHMMAASVNNSSSALGRSGESKMADVEATAVVLGALGRMVRSFAERVYTLISGARGEKDTRWQVDGLDTFEVDDRAAVLEEALQVDNVGIPSKTFKTEYKKHLASKLLPDVDPQKIEAIGKEIEAAVQTELDLMAQMAKDPAQIEPNDGGTVSADPNGSPMPKPNGARLVRKRKAPVATATP